MKPADYFSDEAIRADLRGKTVRGGLYAGIQQGATFLIAFATVPILARLLDPADYGLLAMVVFFTNFANMFVNAGLTAATVQRESVTHEQSSNLFWIAVAVGACTAAMVSASSPLIAWLYGEPRLIAITVALSTSFVIAGLTVQHQSLLRRAMRFRSLAVIQIAATVVAQVVGVTWAWLRQGEPDDYWALVTIPVTVSFVLMVGVWVACAWRPGGWRSGAGTISLLRFGANLTGANLMNYVVRSVDRPLIGWYSGDAPLGLYDRAHRMMVFPLSSITSALSAVMVPALSRVAHDAERLGATHLRIVRLLLLVIALPTASLPFTADWWIEVILGPGWEGAAPIFRWFAIAGWALPMFATVMWLFIVQDGADKLFRWTLVEMVVALACYVVGMRWGPEGVAAAFSLCVLLFRFPGLVWWASRHGLIDAGGFAKEVLHALPPIVAMALAHAALLWLAPADLGPIRGVVLSLTIVLVVMLTVLIATPHGRRIHDEAREALRVLGFRRL